jgi:hypothetical protein
MELLTKAQLLIATGRDTEALEILGQAPVAATEWTLVPGEVIWKLERARVNGRLGNADAALRDYAYYR